MYFYMICLEVTSIEKKVQGYGNVVTGSVVIVMWSKYMWQKKDSKVTKRGLQKPQLDNDFLL